jgi:hypothetical protein
MDMVGQQAVSMDSNAISLGISLAELEMALVFLRLDKTGFAIIAALNDRVGLPGRLHPCTPRHFESLTNGAFVELALCQ